MSSRMWVASCSALSCRCGRAVVPGGVSDDRSPESSRRQALAVSSSSGVSPVPLYLFWSPSPECRTSPLSSRRRGIDPTRANPGPTGNLRFGALDRSVAVHGPGGEVLRDHCHQQVRLLRLRPFLGRRGSKAESDGDSSDPSRQRLAVLPPSPEGTEEGATRPMHSAQDPHSCIHPSAGPLSTGYCWGRIPLGFALDGSALLVLH